MFNKRRTIIVFLFLIVIFLFIIFLKNNNEQIENRTYLTEGECGLVVISPKENERVENQFKVEVLVDNSKREELGCSWTVFEGQAGIVRIYDARGFSVGSGFLEASGEWMTTSPVSFYAPITIDIEPINEDLFMVITEDDPADSGDISIIEVPLRYKK